MEYIILEAADRVVEQELQKARMLRQKQVREQACKWTDERRRRLEEEKVRARREYIMKVTEQIEEEAQRRIQHLLKVNDLASAEVGAAHRAALQLAKEEEEERIKMEEKRKEMEQRAQEAKKRMMEEQKKRDAERQEFLKRKENVRQLEDSKSRALIEERKARLRKPLAPLPPRAQVIEERRGRDSPDAWQKGDIGEKMTLQELQAKAKKQEELLKKTKERGKIALQRERLQRKLSQLQDQLFGDEQEEDIGRERRVEDDLSEMSSSFAPDLEEEEKAKTEQKKKDMELRAQEAKMKMLEEQKKREAQKQEFLKRKEKVKEFEKKRQKTVMEKKEKNAPLRKPLTPSPRPVTPGGKGFPTTETRPHSVSPTPEVVGGPGRPGAKIMKTKEKPPTILETERKQVEMKGKAQEVRMTKSMGEEGKKKGRETETRRKFKSLTEAERKAKPPLPPTKVIQKPGNISRDETKTSRSEELSRKAQERGKAALEKERLKRKQVKAGVTGAEDLTEMSSSFATGSSTPASQRNTSGSTTTRSANESDNRSRSPSPGRPADTSGKRNIKKQPPQRQPQKAVEVGPNHTSTPVGESIVKKPSRTVGVSVDKKQLVLHKTIQNFLAHRMESIENFPVSPEATTSHLEIASSMMDTTDQELSSASRRSRIASAGSLPPQSGSENTEESDRSRGIMSASTNTETDTSRSHSTNPSTDATSPTSASASSGKGGGGGETAVRFKVLF